MVLVRPEDYSDENSDDTFAAYKLKTPKRVLQFSDGVLEEYSTDEEAERKQPPTQEVADPARMAWGPWMIYKTWAAGSSTLSIIDYVGEALASFFGITTPRYYFELEEYKRRKANEERQAEEEKGWSEKKHDIIEVPLQNMSSSPNQPKVEEV